MRIFSLIFPVISALSFWKGIINKEKSADRISVKRLTLTLKELPSADKEGHSSVTASGNTPVPVPDLQSPSLSVHFSCVYVHIYMYICACLLSLDKSNSLSDLHRRKVCFTALSECFFPCQYQQYHRWQRSLRDWDPQGQTQVNTWALLCHSSDPFML